MENELWEKIKREADREGELYGFRILATVLISFIAVGLVSLFVHEGFTLGHLIVSLVVVFGVVVVIRFTESDIKNKK